MPDNELASAFGEEFAEKHQQEVNRRRQERNKVSDEVLRDIAKRTINNDEFDPENPHMTFTSENDITHDVVLMKVPDPENTSIWNYADKLDSGAISMPMEYMGEWMSCLFNEEDMARELTEGRFCIAVGNMSEWERDDGSVKDQMSPVRGIIPLDEAKDFASKGIQEEGFAPSGDESTEEEETEETSEEEEVVLDEEDDEGGMFGDEEEEESEYGDVDYDEVEELVHELAEKEEQIWEVTDEDDKRLDKLAKVVNNRISTDGADVDNIKIACLDVIKEEVEEEEEEEDEEESIFG